MSYSDTTRTGASGGAKFLHGQNVLNWWFRLTISWFPTEIVRGQPISNLAGPTGV